MDLLRPTSAEIDLDPGNIHEQYARRRFGELSDDAVFDIAARFVAVPRRDPADSFGLHAPLELLARRSLLSFVDPAAREPIRERMLWVAATYRHSAAPAEPVARRTFDSVPAASAALLFAIEAGDLDAVDAIAVWLTEHGSPEAVGDLAAAFVDSLAAAGHASIYFSLLRRVSPPSRSALALLRPLVHEVARAAKLRVEWVHGGLAAPTATGAALGRALSTMPRLGLPGSDFIFPIVHQVDHDGLARDIVGPTLPADVDEATRVILRVAAMSMLQDDPASAPYGWTHCLTLPQAVLAISPRLASPMTGVAIAATYVAGFRAAEARRDVDPTFAPEPVAVDVLEALEAEPPVAAAAVHHAADTEIGRLVPLLAAYGGAHSDAHVAKYTLACFDAAGRDHDNARVYLAAAAYLQAWWRQPEPAAA
jgi:hypothetical protein